MGVYLGRLRPEYPGTDALSLSVAPQALIWLETADPQLSWVFGEGARLSHPSFLLALAAKTDLVVGHVVVPPEVAAARRAVRPGKALSEQYCKIAASKAQNLASWAREAGIPLLELDGSRPVEELAEKIFCNH